MFDFLTSPLAFLQAQLPGVPIQNRLRAYETWWETHGKPISDAVDRAGTPHVRLYDRFGKRIDAVDYIPEYWRLLHTGYEAGAVWLAFEQSLVEAYTLGYITCFYDIGLNCPYTVSLSTAIPLSKYGGTVLVERYLDKLLRKDNTVWQGATWMTEIGGGSDLGGTVDTLARHTEQGWRLKGEKYFCSNVGAELAVVAARVTDGDGTPRPGVRGLALFLVPRVRQDGSLNYLLRRLKDKIGTRSVPTGEVSFEDAEAYLLGTPEHGIYLILEVLNLSRVSNAIGSVALAQRAMAEAYTFARDRVAFGKPLIEQPLMRRQFEQQLEALQNAFALAWEAVQMMNTYRDVKPPYSRDFGLLRLIIHLAKYYTAEIAVRSAKWAMEVNGGMGTLAEFGVERWLREAMIVDIWEGPPHRQILDGLEVLERGAGRMLLEMLEPHADPDAMAAISDQLSAFLTLPPEEREANAQPVFEALAEFTARTLAAKLAGVERVLAE